MARPRKTTTTGINRISSRFYYAYQLGVGGALELIQLEDLASLKAFVERNKTWRLMIANTHDVGAIIAMLGVSVPVIARAGRSAVVSVEVSGLNPALSKPGRKPGRRRGRTSVANGATAQA